MSGVADRLSRGTGGRRDERLSRWSGVGLASGPSDRLHGGFCGGFSGWY